MKRRNFIRQATAAGIMIGGFPYASLANISEEAVSLTILHTNDVHSRLDPFPAGSGKYEGLGGVAHRASLINQIRSENKNVLLVDAGDILQGTPYFNLFKGEVDFKVMNAMKYDVATIGNHDFDAGIEQLAINTKMASFDFVNVNYDFSDTPMNNLVKPYVIKTYDNVRVGIFGVGIELENLVPKEWFGETRHQMPIAIANETATHLRKVEKCDFIICLSHLGYEFRTTEICDVPFSQSTRNIDLIIGGHTHTFLDIPDVRRNLDGQPVIISQAGWAGIKLGRLDLTFHPGSKKNTMKPNHAWVNGLGKRQD